MTDSTDPQRKRTGITHVMQSVPGDPNEATVPAQDGRRVMKRFVNEHGELVTQWVLAEDETLRSGITSLMQIPQDAEK